MAKQQLEEIYDKAGFKQNLGFGDLPALIIIDLQRGFTDPDHSLGTDHSNVVNSTGDLVDIAHVMGIPVIFVVLIYRHPEGKDGGLFLKRHPNLKQLQAGSHAAELDPRFDVWEDDFIVEKRVSSSFHETGLDRILQYYNIDTVVVTGCNTSGCIRATVIDACQRSYYTVVPEECVGDRSIQQHEANIFDMRMKYADVVSVDMVKEYFENEAVPVLQ